MFEFSGEAERNKLILLRKGNKSVDNPSSDLSIKQIEKLLEGMLVKRITDYLERNNSLSGEFGFRRSMSTVDAIKKVTNIAEEDKNKKSLVHSLRLIFEMLSTQ